MKVINGFSASMLPEGDCEVSFSRITDAAEYVANAIGYDSDYPDSAIGHADTAALVSAAINYKIAANRVNVSLRLNECALLAQYVGPRLPEGTTVLPEGARLDFFEVKVLPRRNDEKLRAQFAPSMLELARLQKLTPAELRAVADEKEKAMKEEWKPGDYSSQSMEEWLARREGN